MYVIFYITYTDIVTVFGSLFNAYILNVIPILVDIRISEEYSLSPYFNLALLSFLFYISMSTKLEGKKSQA